MPTWALLYDVHGNLNALEAVLRDTEQANARHFVLGGDYALFGPQPAETIERLRSLPNAIWIRGNGERWSASPEEAPEDDVVQGAIQAACQILGPDTVDELAALPAQAVLSRTRYCHGSPVSDVRSFMPQPADDETELLAGVSEPRLVFGHTHLPFARRSASGTELINPGSVGMPFDEDPRAAYALLHPDGQVEHRRVEYDHLASARAVQERFDDAAWTKTVANRIANARF